MADGIDTQIKIFEWIPPQVREPAQQALDQKILGQPVKDLAQVAAQAAVKNGFQFSMPGMVTAALASNAPKPEAAQFVRTDKNGDSVYRQGNQEIALRIGASGQKVAFQREIGSDGTSTKWSQNKGPALYDQTMKGQSEIKYQKEDGNKFSIYKKGNQEYALLEQDGKKYAFQKEAGQKSWGDNKGQALYDHVRDQVKIELVNPNKNGFKIYRDKDGKEVATMNHEKFGKLGYEKGADGKWQRKDALYDQTQKDLAQQKTREPKTIAEEALGALKSLPKELQAFKESRIKAGQERFWKEFAKDPTKAIIDAEGRIARSSLSESEKQKELGRLQDLKSAMTTSSVYDDPNLKTDSQRETQFQKVKTEHELYTDRLSQFHNVAKEATKIFAENPELKSVTLSNGRQLSREKVEAYNNSPIRPFIDPYLAGKLDPNRNYSQLQDGAQMTIQGELEREGLHSTMWAGTYHKVGTSLAIVNPPSTTRVASND